MLDALSNNNNNNNNPSTALAFSAVSLTSAAAAAAAAATCGVASSSFHPPTFPPRSMHYRRRQTSITTTNSPATVPNTTTITTPSPTTPNPATAPHHHHHHHHETLPSFCHVSSHYQQPSTRSNNNNNNSNSHLNSSSNRPRSLASLHELTERIADLLHVGALHSTHPNNPQCPQQDSPLGYLTANTHVTVIFGKSLIRDQITVEYAKRIVTLIKQVASNALKPHIICFTGATSSSCKNTTSSISEAVTGYGFFRAICEEVNLDVSKFTFILDDHNHDNTPHNKNNVGDTGDTLRHVIDKLRSRLGSAVMSSSHFTLVSSDYHLIRIQEIHRLSPRQSILFPLDVSSATWNCIFAAYPFCVSRDPATAFLGRAVVLADDLDIVLVNMNGAVEDREFVSRENLHRLNETSAKMREMYRLIDAKSVGDGVGMSVGIGDNLSGGGAGINGIGGGVGGVGGVGGNVRFGNGTGLGAGFGFQSDMRSHAETLELAIQDVREVQRLLAPLLTDAGASVPRNHLAHARSLLKDTVTRIRTSMDPDRILRVHDRLAIIDDLTSFIEQEARKSSMSAQSAPTPPSLPLPPKPLKGDAALKQQRNNNSNRKIAARVQLANSTTRSKSDITSSSAASTSVPTSRTVKNNNNNNNNNNVSSSTSPANTTQQFSPATTSQSSAHPPTLPPSPLTSTTTTSSTSTTTTTTATTPCSSSSSRTSYHYKHHQNQNQQHELITSPFPFELDTKLSSSSRALSWSDKPLPSPYSSFDSDDELIGGTSVRRLQADDVQVRNIRRRIKSEIRWQDGVNFKGNGKKITRDGPNIVITDNTIPTIPTPRQRTTPPTAASRKKRTSNNSAASTSAITTTTRRTSTTAAAAAAAAAAATSKNSVKTNAGRAGNVRNSAAGSGSRSSTTSRKRTTSASAKKRKGCPTSRTSSTTKTTSAKGGKS